MNKILYIGLISIVCLQISGCSNNIATVNGSGITVGNYQIVLELNKQSIEAYYGDTIWDQEVEDGVTYREKFKEMILDQMVYTESIYQTAKEENLLATEEEVNKAIEDFKMIKR